jgi:hypothetical protein
MNTEEQTQDQNQDTNAVDTSTINRINPVDKEAYQIKMPTSSDNNASATNATDNTSDTMDDNSGADKDKNEGQQDQTTSNQAVELNDDQVLAYLKEKKGKEYSSMDDLFKAPEPTIIEKEVDLDDEVKAFKTFREQTGRGLSDYMKYMRSADSISDNEHILSHYHKKYPHASIEELEKLSKFDLEVDEEEHSDRDILERTMLRNSIIAEQKQLFEAEKETYGKPIESRGGNMPEEEAKLFNSWKESIKQEQEDVQAVESRRTVFTDKTNEFFSNGFEGFKYSVGEGKDVTYKVENVSALKEKQMDLSNFYGRFLDENLTLKDANEYHRSIALASDPDKFAKFFYEQGKAEGLLDSDNDSKNIQMRETKKNTTENAPAFTLVSDERQNSDFKIKLPNK